MHRFAQSRLPSVKFATTADLDKRLLRPDCTNKTNQLVFLVRDPLTKRRSHYLLRSLVRQRLLFNT